MSCGMLDAFRELLGGPAVRGAGVLRGQGDTEVRWKRLRQMGHTNEDGVANGI